MTPSQPDTEELLEQAAGGNLEARDCLLARHRDRLRKMVACRLDRRLRPRVDPSDVVQEVLADASRKMDRYLRDRPLPFYPWLRELAWEQLAISYRRHLRAKKRSVRLEEPGFLDLPEDSAAELASRLVDTGSSPSQRLLREEVRQRMQEALLRLREPDREVLVLRHLERLSVAETAEALGISPGAVKVRHLRALDRLRSLLDQLPEEGEP
jgi:RNA polymerase sigma-70 factor (ECF subfamily)